MGDSAMRPSVLRPTRPAALLRLAGSSPRCCHALPGTPRAAHSGASNRRFYDDRISVADYRGGYDVAVIGVWQVDAARQLS